MAEASAPLYSTSRFLVPGMLERGKFDLGAGWSGAPPAYENSRFQLSGSAAVLDRLLLGIRILPDLEDGAVAVAGEAGFSAFRPGNWTLGAVLGGSASLGTFETYHYDHGIVHHGMQGASLDFTAAWKWLYFGLGSLYLRDIREFRPSTDPAGGRPVFAGRYPEYTLLTGREFLGVRFGTDFHFNFEVSAMDERVYNLWIEPSDPISAAAFTYGFAIAWSPSGSGESPVGGPSKRPSAPDVREEKPDIGMPASARPLFDSEQYWRGARFGALASSLGLLTGVAIGALMEDDEYAFFPPEVVYGLAGAVFAIPVGSAWGVYTDARFRNQSRSPLWTLGGTAAGFGAALLLSPVTAGLSFYFAVPLGSVLGFQYGVGTRDP